MKTTLLLTVGILLVTVSKLSAATLYVSQSSASPTPPYASWSTAATNIQSAVDAAVGGDTVLVTNGLYAGGVTVAKPLTLLGINGAQFTVINGGGTNQCVSMTDGASLSGFTLTNGSAGNGGGVWCSSTNAYLTNCVIVGNAATNGGGAYSGTLYNCLLSGNSVAGAQYGLGGGAFESALYNCTVCGNLAFQMGGVWSRSKLYNCIIYNNTAQYDTNFSSGMILNYCCTAPMPTNGVGNITNAPLFIDYAAGNLRLQSNSPCINAGNNNFVYGTSDLDGNARISGGTVDMGAYEFQFSGPPLIFLQPLSHTLYAGSDVTFTVSAAGSLPLSWQWQFNGAAITTATNSGLTLAPVRTSQTGSYSVVITNSFGSITSQVAVLTVKDAAPSITSQPIGQTVMAGTNVTLTTDAVGSLPLSWQWNFNGSALRDATNSNLTLAAVTTNQAGNYFVVITNSLGSTTSQVAVLTVLLGPPPSITLQPLSQTVSAGGSVTFTAAANGFMPFYWQWLFKGTAIPDATNASLTLPAVTADQAGIYSVVVSNAVGSATSVEATLTVRVAGTKYVWQYSSSPMPPYASWATAATTIQDAVDAAVPGDQIMVTNGVYAGGVQVTNPLALEAVNGPQLTVIDGHGSDHCIFSLADGLSLTGFTLTNGSALFGGGIWCSTANGFLTNCVLVSNSASQGGGAYGATLFNCTLTNNLAGGSPGGGAELCTLYNCTLNGNRAPWAGAADSSTLYNCIVSSNTAVFGPGGVQNCTVHNSALIGNLHGAAVNSTLYNCTLTGNPDGGALDSTLNNSIAYFNPASGAAINATACVMNYCCTTPAPTNGLGNITNAPLFVDQANGDFHLQAGSPCINAGNNAFVSGTTDLDGSPRIAGGAVDMGAYEFQASGLPFIYMQPVSQTVYSGSDVSFKAPAFGSTPLAWQWWFNNAAIPNATNTSFVLPSVTTNQAGNYFVVVANVLGSTTSHVAVLTVLFSGPSGQISYVAPDSPNPTPPYNSWATAAHVIQDAVDAVSSGALVLVTNGIYAIGGRTAVPSLVPNRVAVDKTLTVQSVNGPQFTVIEGSQVPGLTNGPGAVRCVYLASGATLSGFTLTNGATYQLGGDWGNEQSGGGVWSASAGATVTNCIIAGNSAGYAGAGANGGTLIDCKIVGNQTTGANNSGNSVGGGANGANLVRCTVTSNSAGGQYGSGGGASGSSLSECLVNYNSATDSGGGVYWQCSLTNCTLIGNSAGGYGGGARGESGGTCTLYNCFLTGNSSGSGGGASGCQLYNCTLTGNSVDHLNPSGFAYSGGGVSFCSLLNCIVYYNTAVWGTANYDPASSFTNCCTTPLPQIGSGNISFEPQLASPSHLSSASPCRVAGLVGSANGTDIDGEPWGNPPSIGCDEYYAGATAGPLTVAIVATTNATAGSQVPFTAIIEGQTSSSVWDFGDGIIVSNRPYASHAWTIAGDYAVVLRVFNDSQPNGVAATVTAHVSGQSTHYVTVNNTNPVPPFTTWATAAANIQDAVEASKPGDEILVGNGVYAVGGRAAGTNQLLNRVAVTNQLSLRSANGPQSTFIQGVQAPGGGNGNGAIRCVYLANGSSLSGFTLTNGATLTNGDLETDQAGGGVWCESTSVTLSNCVLIGNSAFFGGGSYRGSMYNCLVNSNSATGNMFGGGGAYQSTLYNCTLTGNSANSFAGGGVAVATLFNSIVYYNTALMESNYYSSTLNYCATTPTPTNGVGNSPLFVDGLGGNFHLQAASPCINAGNNAYIASNKDFDGNPRVAGGTVDIGAYEFQNPKSIISYDWLEQYGFPTDGSADFLDPDGDGMNNWQEWIAGTNPTNALSCLRLLSAISAGGNLTVSWQSVAGVNYFLQRSANLGSPFTLVLTNIVRTGTNIVLIGTNSVVVGTNIVGQAGTTAYTDTNTTGAGPFFYRVGVNGP